MTTPGRAPTPLAAQEYERFARYLVPGRVSVELGTWYPALGVQDLDCDLGGFGGAGPHAHALGLERILLGLSGP
jgi:hypothetical protein